MNHQNEYNTKLSFTEIHITDNCNLSCYFCNQKYYRYCNKLNELSYDTIVNVLNQMKIMGLKYIRISGGGEPTDHNEFTSLIKYIVQNDLFLYNLSTNGVYRNHQINNILVNSNILNISFSILTPNNKFWAKITNCKNLSDYNNLLDNIKRIIDKRGTQKRPLVSLKFGIDPTTNYIKDAYDLGLKLGVDRIHFFTYNSISYDSFDTDEIIDQLQSVIRNKDDSIDIQLWLKDVRLNQKLFEMNKYKKLFRTRADEKCYMPWYGSLIRANGDVECCCAGGVKTIMGNIYNNRISEIWHGTKYQEVRNLFCVNVRDDYLIAERCKPQVSLDDTCAVKNLAMELLRAQISQSPEEQVIKTENNVFKY